MKTSIAPPSFSLPPARSARAAAGAAKPNRSRLAIVRRQRHGAEPHAGREHEADDQTVGRLPYGEVEQEASASQRRPAYVNSNAYYIDVWVVSGGPPFMPSIRPADRTRTSRRRHLDVYDPGLHGRRPILHRRVRNRPRRSKPVETCSRSARPIFGIQRRIERKLTLTMLMGARCIGVMSDPDDSNSDSTAPHRPVHLHPAVLRRRRQLRRVFLRGGRANGFVNLAGLGGVSQPIVTRRKRDRASSSRTRASTAVIPINTATSDR